jgi:NifU-like protein involved in Fe-S cluster formation
MSRYSETLLDHARYPRNFRVDEAADVVGTADFDGRVPAVTIYLRIFNERITSVSFQAGGCAVIVAACSALSMLAEGKKVNTCIRISPEDIARALEGVPADKMFSAELAVAAFCDGLNKWRYSTERECSSNE